MNNRNKLAVLFLSLAISLPLLAQPAPTFDRVTFSVTAMEEVRSDTIVGTLGVSLQGKDTSQMAGKINATISGTIEMLR